MMNKMFKSHSSTKKEESDSESEASAICWKQGTNLVQQMYIAQQYRTDNSMESNKEDNSIDDCQLKGLRKKAKKVKKILKRSWEVYTVQRVALKQQKVPKEQLIGQSNQQYADICVMVKDPRIGKEKFYKRYWIPAIQSLSY